MQAENQKYYKNEYLIHSGGGVCIVEDVGMLQMEKIPRVYYTLKPFFEENCKIYVPVDKTTCIIRRVLTKKEALAFVESIPLIEAIKLDDNKANRYIYKTALETNDGKTWISMFKAIRLRKTQLEGQNRAPNVVDEHYLKRVSSLLFSELSVTLGISVKQAEDIISERIFA